MASIEVLLDGGRSEAIAVVAGAVVDVPTFVD